MDEGGVDHAVRGGGSAAQAIQVFEIAAKRLGASRGKRLCARLRAGEAEHPMARVDELPNDGGADKTRSAGDEYTHGDFSFDFA